MRISKGKNMCNIAAYVSYPNVEPTNDISTTTTTEPTTTYQIIDTTSINDPISSTPIIPDTTTRILYMRYNFEYIFIYNIIIFLFTSIL